MSVKDLENYVSNLKYNVNGISDAIVVEHRSNNPKRDYLFVNKFQAKHIPCRAEKTYEICKKLAEQVEKGLNDRYSNILVVGFAETATGLANIIANMIKRCNYLITTTREYIDPDIALELFTFKEEHSHATTQKLYTWKNDVDDFKQFDYILFVEDEISTGKTITNFINAFNNQKIIDKHVDFGVASICNWQSDKNKANFHILGVDTFYLIGGELRDERQKMDLIGITLDESKEIFKKNIETVKYTVHHKTNEPMQLYTDRLLHQKKTLRSVITVEDREHTNTARVIGTEECMHTAIEIAKFLEDEEGVHSICHATTRSRIDVMNGSSDFYGEITERYELHSAYDTERKTYIYNMEQFTDLVVVITDSLNEEAIELFKKDMINLLNDKCNRIMFICM